MKILMDLEKVQGANSALIQHSIDLLRDAREIVRVSRTLNDPEASRELEKAVRDLLRISDEVADQAKNLNNNVVKLNTAA